MSEHVTRRDEAVIRRRQTMRLGAMAIVTAVAAALILDNRQRVQLNYLVGERDAPLIVALLVAVLVGVMLGWSARRGRER